MSGMRRTPVSYPLAYLITFRTYGTWIHGDERGSIDRHRNVYGMPRIPESPRWRRHKLDLLKSEPVTLGARRRTVVESAIRGLCEENRWHLQAVNVRTNHVHAVVAADLDPERLLTALKARATRQMRETECWESDRSPWASGGSRRYLWTPNSVLRAIEYVLDEQGPPLPEL